MTCAILEITQPAPRNDGPDFPPDLCDFCDLPFDGCHCDEPLSYSLSDFGRANVNETPAIRQAHRQAAWNGNSGICAVLEGIHPALKDALPDYEPCPSCGSETPDFCECDPEPPAKPEPSPIIGPQWTRAKAENFNGKRFEN